MKKAGCQPFASTNLYIDDGANEKEVRVRNPSDITTFRFWFYLIWCQTKYENRKIVNTFVIDACTIFQIKINYNYIKKIVLK